MIKDDYAIGYKKPPQHSQFQKGQSGNPKGRPKGAKNLATDLKEELEEKIIISEGGQPHEVTKQRAMIKALLAKALKGDPRAANALINLKLGLEHNEATKPTEDALSEDEQTLLDLYIQRQLSSQSKSTTGDSKDG
ncbi:MAG: DUF5681 domain-containing protein [Candidatus Thiodiazotropha taylori]|nr:DUF5681 domain-containing protein [Candidatus Thiodiazotropha taylori]